MVDVQGKVASLLHCHLSVSEGSSALDAGISMAPAWQLSVLSPPKTIALPRHDVSFLLGGMSIDWPGCQAGERGWPMSSGLALVATPAWCGTKTMSQPVER